MRVCATGHEVAVERVVDRNVFLVVKVVEMDALGVQATLAQPLAPLGGFAPFADRVPVIRMLSCPQTPLRKVLFQRLARAGVASLLFKGTGRRRVEGGVAPRHGGFGWQDAFARAETCHRHTDGGDGGDGGHCSDRHVRRPFAEHAWRWLFGDWQWQWHRHHQLATGRVPALGLRVPVLGDVESNAADETSAAIKLHGDAG